MKLEKKNVCLIQQHISLYFKLNDLSNRLKGTEKLQESKVFLYGHQNSSERFSKIQSPKGYSHSSH